jgi:hypothetical protein
MLQLESKMLSRGAADMHVRTGKKKKKEWLGIQCNLQGCNRKLE